MVVSFNNFPLKIAWKRLKKFGKEALEFQSISLPAFRSTPRYHCKRSEAITIRAVIASAAMQSKGAAFHFNRV